MSCKSFMSCKYGPQRHLAGDYCPDCFPPNKTKAVKKVYVTAYPNIAPAGTTIVRPGEGSTLQVAIGRAIDEVFKADKLKGKRIKLPMKLVVTEGGEG